VPAGLQAQPPPGPPPLRRRRAPPTHSPHGVYQHHKQPHLHRYHSTSVRSSHYLRGSHLVSLSAQPTPPLINPPFISETSPPECQQHYPIDPTYIDSVYFIASDI
jgi:hypothetical protein